MGLMWLLFTLIVRCGLAYKIGTDGKNCGQTPIPPLLDEDDRIFGGSEAVPGSWPWHAGIFTKELFSKHICSGALISDRHVVTAAHCLMRKTSKMLLVHLGAHDQNNVEAGARTLEVAEVCFHKKYKPPHVNDIAILTMKETVNFTKTIGPVCLPDSNHELPENTDTYVTGWGQYKAYETRLVHSLRLRERMASPEGSPSKKCAPGIPMDRCWSVPLLSAGASLLFTLPQANAGLLYVLFMEKFGVSREIASWPHTISTLMTTFVGAFRDNGGSYDNLYRLCGGLDLFAALLLLTQAWVHARKKERRCS